MNEDLLADYRASLEAIGYTTEMAQDLAENLLSALMKEGEE
jgi:hypothetical protein